MFFFQIDLDELQFLTRILYNGRVENSPFAENELDYIFILRKTLAVAPDAEEVKNIEYVSRNNFEEFLNHLSSTGVPITPWFNLISRNFLLSWWDNLDKLDEMRETNKIHNYY